MAVCKAFMRLNTRKKLLNRLFLCAKVLKVRTDVPLSQNRKKGLSFYAEWGMMLQNTVCRELIKYDLQHSYTWYPWHSWKPHYD